MSHRPWTVAVLALLLVSLSCQRDASAPLPNLVAPLGRLELPTLDGKRFSAAEHARRVVAVTFWSPG